MKPTTRGQHLERDLLQSRVLPPLEISAGRAAGGLQGPSRDGVGFCQSQLAMSHGIGQLARVKQLHGTRMVVHDHQADSDSLGRVTSTGGVGNCNVGKRSKSITRFRGISKDMFPTKGRPEQGNFRSIFPYSSSGSESRKTGTRNAVQHTTDSNRHTPLVAPQRQTSVTTSRNPRCRSGNNKECSHGSVLGSTDTTTLPAKSKSSSVNLVTRTSTETQPSRTCVNFPTEHDVVRSEVSHPDSGLKSMKTDSKLSKFDNYSDKVPGTDAKVVSTSPFGDGNFVKTTVEDFGTGENPVPGTGSHREHIRKAKSDIETTIRRQTQTVPKNNSSEVNRLSEEKNAHVETVSHVNDRNHVNNMFTINEDDVNYETPAPEQNRLVPRRSARNPSNSFYVSSTKDSLRELISQQIPPGSQHAVSSQSKRMNTLTDKRIEATISSLYDKPTTLSSTSLFHSRSRRIPGRRTHPSPPILPRSDTVGNNLTRRGVSPLVSSFSLDTGWQCDAGRAADPRRKAAAVEGVRHAAVSEQYSSITEPVSAVDLRKRSRSACPRRPISSGALTAAPAADNTAAPAADNTAAPAADNTAAPAADNTAALAECATSAPAQRRCASSCRTSFFSQPEPCTDSPAPAVAAAPTRRFSRLSYSAVPGRVSVKPRREIASSPSEDMLNKANIVPNQRKQDFSKPTRTVNDVNSESGDKYQRRISSCQIPDVQLPEALARLGSGDWERAISGLAEIVKIIRYDPSPVLRDLRLVCSAVCRQCQNLRSQVSRAAIHTIAVLFENVGSRMEPVLDGLIPVLLQKTAGMCEFIKAEGCRALDALVRYGPLPPAITHITHAAQYQRSAQVQCTVARLLNAIVARLGARASLCGRRTVADKLVQAAFQLARKSDLQTRKHAKATISEWLRVDGGEKLILKHLNVSAQSDARLLLDRLKKESRTSATT